jgi:hypothetical protein
MAVDGRRLDGLLDATPTWDRIMPEVAWPIWTDGRVGGDLRLAVDLPPRGATGDSRHIF